MQAKRTRPIRMFLPLIALLVLAALWSVWWYVVFSTVKSRYAEQTQQLAAQGVALACASQSWGGYPFRVEMDCEQAQFRVTRGAEQISASAPRLQALLQAYNPTHVIVLLTGPSSVTTADGRTLDIAHGVATTSARLIEDNNIQISSAVPDVAVAGLGSAKSVMIHLRGGRRGKADLAATAQTLSIGLPTGKDLVIDRAEAEASAPAELLAGGDPIRQAAQSGAVLEITRVQLSQGQLSIEASGTASLDPQGRLNGKATASVSDIDLLLQRITTDFDLSENDVQAVKTMLGILKSSGSKIEIAAKEGKLYWGLIKLGEIPPLLPGS